MKHLCGCFETQSLSWSVIQSVLNHCNFLLINRIHQSLFRHILTQQAIKVLVGALLPTCKGSGKVASAFERLVNLNVRRKLFAVVVGQRFDPTCKGLEPFNNGVADQLGSLVSHLDYDPEAALALDHRHNGPLVVRADDRVAFPMAHLLSSFDMRRPIPQGAPVRDLAPSVLPAGVALSLLLLAAQVLPQLAASGLVGINMLVKRLMADWQLASNLLRTPLQAQQMSGLLAHPGGHSRSVSALLRSLGPQLTGLLGPIAFKPAVARKLPADGGLVSIQQLGNLSLIVSGFHKGVDLISFNLAEMFVGHGQLRLAGQEALNAKHSQPPSPQLIKVALRA